MICSKCECEVDSNKLPPSLRDKLKMCVVCYKKTKLASDRAWYLQNKEVINRRRQAKRNANPKETAIEWKERTLRWKTNKRKRAGLGLK